MTRSPYTLPTDLEDEACVVAQRRSRIIRAGVSKETVKRIERSQRQMIINRRNAAKKKEQSRVIRRSRTAQ